MQYVSTRGHVATPSFCEILLGGLAPDGGLYLPAVYPQVTPAELDRWRALPYADLAFEVLKKFATDIPDAGSTTAYFSVDEPEFNTRTVSVTHSPAPESP